MNKKFKLKVQPTFHVIQYNGSSSQAARIQASILNNRALPNDESFVDTRDHAPTAIETPDKDFLSLSPGDYIIQLIDLMGDTAFSAVPKEEFEKDVLPHYVELEPEA